MAGLDYTEMELKKYKIFGKWALVECIMVNTTSHPRLWVDREHSVTWAPSENWPFLFSMHKKIGTTLCTCCYSNFYRKFCLDYSYTIFLYHWLVISNSFFLSNTLTYDNIIFTFYYYFRLFILRNFHTK